MPPTDLVLGPDGVTFAVGGCCNSGFHSAIKRVGLTGGNVTTIANEDVGVRNPVRLAVRDDDIYWAEGGRRGSALTGYPSCRSAEARQ